MGLIRAFILFYSILLDFPAMRKTDQVGAAVSLSDPVRRREAVFFQTGSVKESCD